MFCVGFARPCDTRRREIENKKSRRAKLPDGMTKKPLRRSAERAVDIVDYCVNWSANQRHEETCLLSADANAFFTRAHFTRAHLRHAVEFGTIRAEPLNGLKPTAELRQCGAEPGKSPALAFWSDTNEKDHCIHRRIQPLLRRTERDSVQMA